MWFPETAIDASVIELLPELGITFTVVAPYQVTPSVPAGSIGTWTTASGATVEFVVYDGAVSHDLAFGSLLADTGKLIDRMAGSARSGLVAGRHRRRDVRPSPPIHRTAVSPMRCSPSSRAGSSAPAGCPVCSTGWNGFRSRR